MKKLSKKYWTFLILICLSNQALGDSVVFLQKNDPAPFPGFLFDEKAGKEIKAKLVDLEYFQKLNESLEKQVKSHEAIEVRLNEKVTVVEDRNNVLAKNLQSERSMSDFERILWFGGGILATILVLYGVDHVKK